MQDSSVWSRWLQMLAALLACVLVAGCGPVSPKRAAEARQALNGSADPMTFQLPERPTAFDPFAAPGTADALLAAAQFEPLVSAVEGRLMPRLAAAWGMVDDNQVLFATLKRGRWSDDARFGADDVVFTVEAHLRPGSRSPLLPVLLQIVGAKEFHEGRAAHVSGVIAESSRTAVIRLTRPDANYLSKLTTLLILPRHEYEGRDLQSPEVFRQPSVGSGAYLFQVWQGPDQVVLKPNPFITPFTRLRHVVATVVPPDAVRSALEQRTIQVALAIPARDLNALPGEYPTLRAPGDTAIGLIGLRGPLTDPRVRRAVAMGIDRERILAEHFAGNGRVSDSILFTPDWAASPARSAYNHNVQRAKDTLGAAGWRPGSELRIAVLTADRNTALWDAAAQDLAEVGIRATFTIHPVSTRAAVLADPAYAGVVDTYWMALGEPSLVEPWVACGNPSGYCNPRLDELLVEGRTQLGTHERQRTYRAVDELLATDLPVVPLWVPDSSVAVAQGRGGLSPRLQPGTATIDLWGPA